MDVTFTSSTFATVIAIVIVVLSLLYYLFPFIEICGESMLPTYFDGEILIGRRITKNSKFQIGKAYVYTHSSPYSEEEKIVVIKRLTAISADGKRLFFVGDNRDHSYDSRDYGFVSKDEVIAKVLFKVVSSKGGELDGK